GGGGVAGLRRGHCRAVPRAVPVVLPDAGPPHRDQLAMAIGPEARMQIDERDVTRLGAIAVDDVDEGTVRPGRLAPAEEDSVGMVVLAAGDRLLQRHGTVLGDEGLKGLPPRRARGFVPAIREDMR